MAHAGMWGSLRSLLCDVICGPEEGKCNDFTEIYIYILSLSGSKYCVGHHMTPTMGYQGGRGQQYWV